MKTIAMIAAAVAVTTSVANAGSGIKVERPCGSNCAASQQAASDRPVLGVPFRDLKAEKPAYQSRTVISGPYGTSVINSTIYRSRR